LVIPEASMVPDAPPLGTRSPPLQPFSRSRRVSFAVELLPALGGAPLGRHGKPASPLAKEGGSTPCSARGLREYIHRCSEAGNLIEEVFALISFIRAEPAVEGSQGSTTNRSEKLDRLNLRTVWRVRQMQ
jgi:hypothetical protein